MLRIGVIGASHWHFDNYVSPLVAMPDVRIVAVADRDPDFARQRAESIGCEWSTDYREICRRDKVDFVFALGRHCDMAAQGMYLVDNDTPFSMEKPCGLNAIEVGALAARAEQRASFAAVPFVWRLSDFMKLLGETVAGDRFQYMALRIVSGHPDRYVKSGNGWMLDRALAGGGSTINLAVHLVDLFRVLTTPNDVEVEAASMANTAFGLDIEDWSTLILRAGSSYCVAESGFFYPAPTGTYDMRFTIKTDRHYILAGPQSTDVLGLGGNRTSATTMAANEPTYAAYVADVIERFRQGRRPLADMADMKAVITVTDRAYELAGPLDQRTTSAASPWQPVMRGSAG
jgi:predicted dehydrogenase